MFLQMHSLTSFHASLLNRDDAGLAKRIPFGDAQRLRVSSQCLKRHWTECLRKEISLPAGTRTRHFFSRAISERLIDEKNIEREVADEATKILAALIFMKLKDLKKLHKEKDQEKLLEKIRKTDSYKKFDTDLQMDQPALLGKPEADFLIKLISKELSEPTSDLSCLAAHLLEGLIGQNEKNIDAMLRQAGHGNLYAGFEGALFGRFVTSDILARSDAAVHVAHAFTVHPVATEVDYFTVVDDLNREEETGAAHAGEMELGGGLFYEYIAVDIPLLVSNFTACKPEAWREQDASDIKNTLRALLEAVATVSPGAKLGATAPYARADFALFESGPQQPRSLANAYLQALQFRSGDDPMQQAVDALGKHLQAVDGMYGATAEQRVAATTKQGAALGDIPLRPLDSAIDETLNAIFRG